MKMIRNTAVLSALLLLGAAGCADLAVENPNEPDAERALASAGDVESLIGGAYRTWYLGQDNYDGAGMFLSAMSFQHSFFAANSGMVEYSAFPRVAIGNDPSHPYFQNMERPWVFSYRAISSVVNGLQALENKEVADQLGAENVARARAYGSFVLGIAHGTAALLYDKGYVIDADNFDPEVKQEFVPYTEVAAMALKYLDRAAELSRNASFTIPSSWMSVNVTSDQLARIAHSYAARIRANVARTPSEREAVNWDAVLKDVQQGLNYQAREDFLMNMDVVFNDWDKAEYNVGLTYITFPAWGSMSYFVTGMADQSGNYQKWLSLPLGERRPVFPDGSEFLIITPDQRFPQGSTLAEQAANPGTYWKVPLRGGKPSPVWAREARGVWRWSYYEERYGDALPWDQDTNDFWAEIDNREMALLAAEAHFRKGRRDQAAEIINESRVAAGLNPTNGTGVNTSCVPKLPSGACGDLFEMLKWEKRLEAWGNGLLGAPWYFDSRGWGDLYKGSPLQFPVPASELSLFQVPFYTFGGQQPSASTGSTYAWPSE